MRWQSQKNQHSELAQEASESQPARVVRLWASKREAWAARFEGQFPGGAAMLFSTVQVLGMKMAESLQEIAGDNFVLPSVDP